VTRSGAGDPGRAFIVLHLALAGGFWGSSFLLMKLLDGAVAPVVVAAFRGLLATAALVLAVVAVGQSPWPKGREWGDWLVLGTLNGWLPNILVVIALNRMDSGPAALIQASGPLLTACLAHLFFASERLTAARFAGLGLGGIGMALLIGPQALAGGATLVGTLAMLGLTLCYAVGNVYARVIPAPVPLRLALGQQVVSGIVATLLAVALVGPPGFAAAVPHWAPLLALGLVATAVPIWAFMRLITAAGPTRASMTGYVVPMVAVTLGVIVLGEPLVPRQIIGGLIVLAGVAIVTGLLRWPARSVP
jgi:drug/metabolite transporter (DMT)-like permease